MDVCIKVVSEEPSEIERIEKKTSHCAMVALAGEGKVFYATNEDCICPMARFHLGLQKRNEAFHDILAQRMVKIKHSENKELALKYLKDSKSKTLPEGKKYIIYFPAEKKIAEPDVIIRSGNPEEIMNMVREITKRTGERLATSISGISAVCSEVTAIPIKTKKPNISLGCCGARSVGKLKAEELLIGIPKEYFKYFDFAE